MGTLGHPRSDSSVRHRDHAHPDAGGIGRPGSLRADSRRRTRDRYRIAGIHHPGGDAPGNPADRNYGALPQLWWQLDGYELPRTRPAAPPLERTRTYLTVPSWDRGRL